MSMSSSLPPAHPLVPRSQSEGGRSASRLLIHYSPSKPVLSPKRLSGEGAYGRVYTHPQDPTKKIKSVQWLFAPSDDDQYESFEPTSLREITFLSSYIRHPSIIRCHKSFFKPPSQRVQNQFMKRKPVVIDSYEMPIPNPDTIELVLDNGHMRLCDWINRATLVEQDEHVPWIMFQILHVLSLLERLDIVHNDLKPQNILIDPTTKHVRLIDWGSVVFDSNMVFDWFKRAHIEERKVLTLLCTYNYASPEMHHENTQACGRLRPWHDVFSWGMSLLHFIHHHPPSENEVVEFMAMHPTAQVFDMWNMRHCETWQREMTSKGELAQKMIRKGELVQCCMKREDVIKSCPNFVRAMPVIERMLVLNHERRALASELIQDTFFDGVRSRLPSIDELMHPIIHPRVMTDVRIDTSMLNALFLHHPELRRVDRDRMVDTMFRICQDLSAKNAYTLAVSILDRYLSLPVLSENPVVDYRAYLKLALASIVIACELRYHSMSWFQLYNHINQHPRPFPPTHISKSIRELMNRLKDLWSATFDSLLGSQDEHHVIQYHVVVDVVRKYPLVERYQTGLRTVYLELLEETRRMEREGRLVRAVSAR